MFNSDPSIQPTVGASEKFPAPSQQPVVKVWRRTETGEAPRWQGATTENIGNI